MTTADDQRRHARAAAAAAAATARGWTAASEFPPLSWWYVAWRARVHDASTGDIDACLSAIVDAMAQLDTIEGLPGVRHLGPASVSFEFWFEARTAHEAAGGARVALRQACRAAGVADPTPPSRDTAIDVMLMFEEMPALRRDSN